jgi:hypothetical protein
MDLSEWHTLQLWLADGERRVTVPFAAYLSERIPPLAAGCAATSARSSDLSARTRSCTARPVPPTTTARIVATAEDYEAVRELVADLVSEGISATVRPETRETVEAVATLAGDTDKHVLDRPARRRPRDGQVSGQPTRAGRDRQGLSAQRRGQARAPVQAGARRPAARRPRILPSADEVRECCTVASESGGIKTPPDVDADDDGRTIADLTDDELLAAAGPGATLERSDQRSEPNPEKATP